MTIPAANRRDTVGVCVIYCVILKVYVCCTVPNVQENELSRAIHIEFICQLFKKVLERGSKLLAALTRSRCKEKHHDAILQAHDNLTFCVQLILVLVVLHQNPIDEQVHYDDNRGSYRERWRKLFICICLTGKYLMKLTT